MIFSLLAFARATHFCACLLLFGTCVFDRVIVGPAARGTGTGLDVRWNAIFRGILWWALALALISGLFWLILVSSQMSGMPLLQALKPEVLSTVWHETLFGMVWKWRLIFWLAAALMAGLLSFTRMPSRLHARLIWLALVFSGLLTGGLAWAGHGLIGSGWHRFADVVHLLTAGCWPFGLLPLILIMRAARQVPPVDSRFYVWAVTRRFSNMSLVCVALLTATGILNGWVLVDTLSALVSTLYGILLIAKVLLFCLIVSIGAANRLLLRPPPNGVSPNTAQLPGRLPGRIPLNAAWELAFVTIIMLIIGVLGMVPPPAR